MSIVRKTFNWLKQVQVNDELTGPVQSLFDAIIQNNDSSERLNKNSFRAFKNQAESLFMHELVKDNVTLSWGDMANIIEGAAADSKQYVFGDNEKRKLDVITIFADQIVDISTENSSSIRVLSQQRTPIDLITILLATNSPFELGEKLKEGKILGKHEAVFRGSDANLDRRSP